MTVCVTHETGHLAYILTLNHLLIALSCESGTRLGKLQRVEADVDIS